jgi:recombination protein U
MPNYDESFLLALQARGMKVHDQNKCRETAKQEMGRAYHPNHANRGMALQNLITQSNEQYFQLGIAHIWEPGIPGAWQGSSNKADYNTEFSQKKFFPVARSVDHIGSYRGLSIAFDDKETGDIIFPAGNVKDHQIDFLVNHARVGGGVSFLLIGYVKLTKGNSDIVSPRFFLIEISLYFQKYWSQRRGLKWGDASRYGVEVFPGLVSLDYLRGVDKLIENFKNKRIEAI